MHWHPMLPNSITHSCILISQPVASLNIVDCLLDRACHPQQTGDLLENGQNSHE
jgi:hypothetical protein